MPYKRKGKTVYKKVNGLKKKGKAKSVKKAKRYLNLLRGIEHGMVPRSARRTARRTRKLSGLSSPKLRRK